MLGADSQMSFSTAHRGFPCQGRVGSSQDADEGGLITCMWDNYDKSQDWCISMPSSDGFHGADQ